jgi:hypothetical protein
VLDPQPCARASDDVNWVPLTIVTAHGTLKRATQLNMKASTHLQASMNFMGTAAVHFVDLSVMGSRYTYPSEDVHRGPTMHRCRCENLRARIGMAWRGAAGCLWILPCWHSWQSWHIAATSLPTPFQTKRAEIILLVACIQGWATMNGLEYSRPVNFWHQGPYFAPCHVAQ